MHALLDTRVYTQVIRVMIITIHSYINEPDKIVMVKDLQYVGYIYRLLLIDKN